MFVKKNVIFLISLFVFIPLAGAYQQQLLDKKLEGELKRNYDSSTVLVSTIDGYLNAIDVISGVIKWRYHEGPILNSPRSIQQEFSYIPNPQTGELYTIVDKQLNKLPFTIPQLVTISPCRSSNGILYSGYKKDVWIAIDSATGVHQETVPPQIVNSCPVGQQPETVFIGRSEYKLVMSDTKRVNRLWNATFVDYSSHLLPINEEYPFQHFHSTTDGRIATFDNTTKEMLWKIDLQSVIVNMYLLEKDGMHKLPSTSVEKDTYDLIEEDAISFISSKWNEEYPDSNAKSIPGNQKLLQTLFIGDSEFGVYALNSFVDKNININQLKTLGPVLIDGFAQNFHYDPNVLQPRLPRNIELQSSIYQTTSGEFLLLGHHEVPPLLLKAVVTGQDHYTTRVPFLTYQQNSQQRHHSGLLDDKSEPVEKRAVNVAKNEEYSWEEIFQQVWRKSPYVVLGFIVMFFLLTIITVYLYGRQVGVTEIMASKTESLPPSYSAQSSHASNRTLSKNGFDNNEDSLSGVFRIGKLSYNPKDVLGKGCEGTKVFRGMFDGREVAVKRVVSDQIKLMEREVKSLRHGDAHRNIIRYYCSETDDNFFYIALQLCDCTLNDYVRDSSVRERFVTDSREILRQATDGIVYMHSINIVHRDLKPQNILLSMNNRGQARAMISDFGLCKMVRYEHASISKTSGLTGTDGWIAPEVMCSDSKSLTFVVDVFSLGCVFYFVISNGLHPFGDQLKRQANIINGHYDLKHLDVIQDYVSRDIIEMMIENEPSKRPPSHVVANHPIFWSKERQLQFFMDVSDRIEKEDEKSEVMEGLERGSFSIFKYDWGASICNFLKQDLTKHRAYLLHTVKDLLRAMRNKKHHYRELDEDVRQSLGSIPDEFVTYFTSRFPRLLIHTYKVMALCANESIFFTYYPEDSRSFCGRIIREEIAEGFVTHGSPKRSILRRQALPGALTQNSPSKARLIVPQSVAGNHASPTKELREVAAEEQVADQEPVAVLPAADLSLNIQPANEIKRQRNRKRPNRRKFSQLTETVNEDDNNTENKNVTTNRE